MGTWSEEEWEKGKIKVHRILWKRLILMQRSLLLTSRLHRVPGKLSCNHQNQRKELLWEWKPSEG